MDQGSNENHSPVNNFVPTVTKFCVLWEGQALPHDTKFGNCRDKIVDSRAFLSWSLIHGSSWSGLIKLGPGCVCFSYDAHLQVQGCPLEGMLAQPPQTFLVQIPTGSSELNSLTAGANPALSTDNTSTSQLVQLPQTQQFLASGPVAMVQLPSGCVENVSQLTGTQPQPTISQPHTVDIAQKQEPIMSSSQMDLNAAMTSASTAGSSLGEFPQPSRWVICWYNVSQKICTWFCGAVLCCGYIFSSWWNYVVYLSTFFNQD